MKELNWVIFFIVTIACSYQCVVAIDILKELEAAVDEVNFEKDQENENDMDLSEMYRDPFLFSGSSNLRCESRRRASRCTVKHNGCGTVKVQRLIPVPNAKLFEPACNKHDICYNCGNTRGWSLNECDRSFWKDVKHICDCNHPGFWGTARRLGCKSLGYSYYGLIKAFGTSAYEKPSKSFCNNNCVIPLGSPKYLY